MSGAGIYIKTDSGLVAAATVPGPQGSQGPQSSLTTGTVTTGAAGLPMRAYSEIAWVTDHQWPTALPGTPA